VFTLVYLRNDVFTATCKGKRITEPLSNNGRPAAASIFLLSGAMS
jgi:hypothetical protein